MPSSLSLSLHVETKTQSPSGGQLRAASPSSRHASRGRLAARLVSRPVLRSVSRSVLLACLVCPAGLNLIGSSACLPIGCLLSSHRLVPCLVSISSPLYRQAGRGGTIGERSLAGGHRRCADDGERMAASACLPRMETTEAGGGGWAGGHRRLMAAGGGCGCLLASWRWTERLDRSSIVSLSLSSAHPTGSVLWPVPSLIISSTGEESSFPFRLTPSRLPFSVCLLWLVPPSPAGGCVGCGMACDGGRDGCLLAFSCPVPLSRCRSFARCYMPCVARAARSFLGRRWAFYGLF